MSRDDRRTCPPWCVADHPAEDEGGRRHHRGETVVVPGIAIQPGVTREVASIELLIELHVDEGDPVVGIYIGDGENGIDVTTETAERLVRRLVETLRAAGAA
jgi:hypothetical protein